MPIDKTDICLSGQGELEEERRGGFSFSHQDFLMCLIFFVVHHANSGTSNYSFEFLVQKIEPIYVSF